MPNSNPLELSVVMPCLNEAETLEICIKKIQWYLDRYDIAGEVIVADNGSNDGSQAIAKQLNARVVNVDNKGYGSALKGGIAAARGRYIIMGDADDSYDFTDLTPFIERLREGYDLVMGNRFKGGIAVGAMPPLHRYLGNPVLTWIGRLFFGSPCTDFHCGLRGFSKVAIDRLDLRTTGMEFASEMVVKATLYRLRITEVPTTLSPDGRSRPPHLRSWRDGWRHLRFLLLYSPRWLFLYPGLLLMFLGSIATLWLLPGPRGVFDIHTLLYATTAIEIGFQSVTFAVFTKIFAITEGLLPQDRRLNRVFSYITLELGLIVGSILLLMGLAGSIYAFNIWESRSFGLLTPSQTMRVVIPSVTCLAIGFQSVLSSFFLSVLGLKR
jgi:glycosyltransferase involved in cell wall biosynthesis